MEHLAPKLLLIGVGAAGAAIADAVTPPEYTLHVGKNPDGTGGVEITPSAIGAGLVLAAAIFGMKVPLGVGLVAGGALAVETFKLSNQYVVPEVAKLLNQPATVNASALPAGAAATHGLPPGYWTPSDYSLSGALMGRSR